MLRDVKVAASSLLLSMQEERAGIAEMLPRRVALLCWRQPS